METDSLVLLVVFFFNNLKTARTLTKEQSLGDGEQDHMIVHHLSIVLTNQQS